VSPRLHNVVLSPPCPYSVKVPALKKKHALQRYSSQYLSQEELDDLLKTIETFLPVVFAREASHLKDRLATTAMGRAFILQGGDYAEIFKELNANNICHTFRILLQMGAMLMFGNQFTALLHQTPTRLRPHHSCHVFGVAPPSAYPVSYALREQIMSSREVQGKEGRELTAAAKTFTTIGGDRVILVYFAAA
jgi:hypothetical protein